MDQNNFFPWDDIPDTNVFPDGIFEFEWDSLDDGYAQTSGKRMFKARFACVQPAEFKGMGLFENYVTGNDEVLQGIVAGAMGTRAMKAALKAAQVPANNDIANLCHSVKGSKLLMKIVQIEEKDGDYKGQLRNKVVACFKIGTRSVEVAKKPGARGAMQAPTVSAPAPAPSAPAPSAPVQAAPTPIPAPTPTPAAPPIPGPVPAPPAANTETVQCQICKEMVPTAEFGAHAQAHVTGQLPTQ